MSVEVGAMLDDYAPPDVRENWTSLAVMLERRTAELAYLVDRLQEAYAAHEVATFKAHDRLEDTWTDALDDSLREASGFERSERSRARRQAVALRRRQGPYAGGGPAHRAGHGEEGGGLAQMPERAVGEAMPRSTRSAARARRGSGEGSVYRTAEGHWCATVDLGRRPDGTRSRRYVKAKTKTAVLAKMSKAKEEIAEGGPVITGRTAADSYLRWWLAEVVAPRVSSGSMKASSAFRYGQVITNYVIPCWGATPLGDIGPEHVDRLLRGLEARGLSNATVKQARTVASVAMRDAVRWGKLRTNPVTAVPGPRKAAGQLDAKVDDVLTGDEALRLLDLATTDRLSALAVIILRLGVRKGEALALRWDDIDFAGSRLRIERTRTRVAGIGVMETATKTKGSERTIPLTVSVHAALLRHRRQQETEAKVAGPAWKAEGYVFSTPTGEGLDPRNALRWWHRLTEQAGLGKRRMHAGRHTAATLLLGAGVPLEVVSSILGHSGIAITADTYARVLEDAKRRAFAAVDLDEESARRPPMAATMAANVP